MNEAAAKSRRAGGKSKTQIRKRSLCPKGRYPCRLAMLYTTLTFIGMIAVGLVVWRLVQRQDKH